MRFQRAWIGSLFGWCSRRCGEIMSLDFDFLFDTLVFTSDAFWFCIGTFITSSSVVADDELLALPIIVWSSDPVLLFSSILELWDSAIAAAERFIFFGRLIVLNSDFTEGWALYDSAVAAAKVTNLPMLVIFSFDQDFAHCGPCCPLRFCRCGSRSISAPMI